MKDTLNDMFPDEENDEIQLYTLYRQYEDGTVVPYAYAYGAPWVAQALFMNDISFDSPEKAKEWWEKNYGAEAKGE